MESYGESRVVDGQWKYLRKVCAGLVSSAFRPRATFACERTSTLMSYCSSAMDACGAPAEEPLALCACLFAR